MSKRISKNEIMKRLNNIKEFVSEYSVDEASITGSTKKANFTHIGCPENHGNDYSFSMIVKDFTGGQRCPLCAAKRRVLSNTKNQSKKLIKNSRPPRRKSLDHYIERINSVNQEYEYAGLYSEYQGSSTKVYVRHKSCGKIFIKRISDFLYNKQLCPDCTGKGGSRKNTEDTINRIRNAGFELVDYNGEYLYTHKSYTMKCTSCGLIQERSLNTIINLSGKCTCKLQTTPSTGEFYIQEILAEQNIRFVTNKTFDNLINISSLRCDIFLPEFNSIIEYDGLQHFKESDSHYFADTLEERHKKDLLKNKYFAENNINILRISYKERNKSNIAKIIKEFLSLAIEIDGKPYDGKLSRTVWVGGKSNYEEYFLYNSK